MKIAVKKCGKLIFSAETTFWNSLIQTVRHSASMIRTGLRRQSYLHALQWRHNGCDGVSNHRCIDYLLNRLFGCRWKKTLKLRVTDRFRGIHQWPPQIASNADDASIWCRHHGMYKLIQCRTTEKHKEVQPIFIILVIYATYWYIGVNVMVGQGTCAREDRGRKCVSIYIYIYVPVLMQVSCTSSIGFVGTTYGDIHLAPNWFRLWIAVWRHQAITWTNVDFISVKSCSIRLKAMALEMPITVITSTHWKITRVK